MMNEASLEKNNGYWFIAPQNNTLTFVLIIIPVFKGFQMSAFD